MEFKTIKTYGRLKTRVIKTDLWITPERSRTRLFSSTSSESSSSFLSESTPPFSPRGETSQSLSSTSQNISSEGSPELNPLNKPSSSSPQQSGLDYDRFKEWNSSTEKVSTKDDDQEKDISKNEPNVDMLSKQIKGMCLLDAKVYLDRDECVATATSSKVPMPSNLSNIVNPSDSSCNFCLLSPADVPLPSEKSEAEDVIGALPNISQIHTPISARRNPVFSPFVEALTPIAFQQTARLLCPIDKVLMQCEQQRALKFTEALPANLLKNCVKVGEGTYGEVFKSNDGVEDVALKIIPVEGDFVVNNEAQKSFEAIIPEIVITKELSNLAHGDDIDDCVHVCSNFIKVKRVMLIQDFYPDKLLNEWDKWEKNHDCENERPDMYQEHQYFIVFEFADGGEDLENFQFSSLAEALSVVRQITISLAVAEESLEFEHRDLHWGNILIKRTQCRTIQYKLNGDDICINNAGVFVGIIDFTLSRLAKDGATVFCDLSMDPYIFKGKGDYQFKVYRLMKKANNNDWETFKPYSNMLWVHYVLDKLLSMKQYKMTNRTIQQTMRRSLRQALSYHSASQAVQNGFLDISRYGT